VGDEEGGEPLPQAATAGLGSGSETAPAAAGLLVPDFAEAARLWRLSAEQGHARALTRLAGLYFSGEGVLRSQREAARLYRRAADAGCPNAQHRLGGMYYQGGQGVPRCPKRAALLWKRAAGQGHASAQANLGFLHYKGTCPGVRKSYRAAARLWKAAAGQGHTSARLNMALLLQVCLSSLSEHSRLASCPALRQLSLLTDPSPPSHRPRCLTVHTQLGRGVKRNLSEAARVFRLAADQGLPDAMDKLGGMCVEASLQYLEPYYNTLALASHSFPPILYIDEP
jgi:TPR repeat protein